jgi:hypothetical protein
MWNHRKERTNYTDSGFLASQPHLVEQVEVSKQIRCYKSILQRKKISTMGRRHDSCDIIVSWFYSYLFSFSVLTVSYSSACSLNVIKNKELL